MSAWSVFFKVLPWAELIAMAPTVVTGAQKLLAAARKQDAPQVTAQGAALQRALEQQIAELRGELTTASELVTRLAEQNNRLVEAVDVLRMRMRVLFAAIAVMAAGLIGLAAAVMQ